MWPFDASTRVYSGAEKWAWASWYLLNLAWTVTMVWSVFHFFMVLYGPVDGVSYGRSYPVWKTAFPSVTVCSQVKIDPITYDFSYHMHKQSALEQARLETLVDASLLCDQHIIVSLNGTKQQEQQEQETQESTKSLNEKFYDFMKTVSHSFGNMFHSCHWRKKEVNCSQLFRQVITDEGICYNFNGVNPWRNNSFFSEAGTSDDWDLQGYKPSAKVETYPKRSIIGGVKGGLEVVLSSRHGSHDPLCKGPTRGFRVQVHNPAEAPYMKNGHFVLPLDQELMLGVEPEKVDGGEKFTKLWAPCARRDTFLANFRQYTLRNCHLECLSNYTLDKCHCTAYWLPRNRTVKVCPGEMKHCIINATGEMLKEKHERYSNINYDWDCKCKPECMIDKYRLDSSVSEFVWASTGEASKRPDIVGKGVSFSRLTVYIKDIWEVDRHERMNEQPATDAWVSAITVATGLTFLLINLILFFVVSSSPAPGTVTGDRNNRNLVPEMAGINATSIPSTAESEGYARVRFD